MKRRAASKLALLLASAMTSHTAEQNTYATMHSDAFRVVGLETRTTNAREQTAAGAIGPMWGRLMQEHLLDRIAGRADTGIVALYTDYETDKDGAYTYLLGAKVRTDEAAVPGGMRAKTVPAGDYAVFRAHGKPATTALGLWQKVWQLETEHRLSRLYQTDYEVHRLATDGDEQVELHIGIKR